MNQIQDTIKHVKSKHLNFVQRVFIQIVNCKNKLN